MAVERGPRAPVPAAVALAAGFGALLALDWGLAAGDGRSGLVAPTVAAAAVVAVVAFVAPAAAPAIAAIGWTTPAGFAAAPYPDLKPGGTLPSALALFAVAAVTALLGRAVRRAGTARARAAEALAAPARAPEALLAAVGHTLRTPLTPIKAAVSSLRQHDVAWSPADQEELLATIEECADRLAAQIADLLDLSRLFAGTLTPLLRPAAVPELAAGFPRPDIELDLPEDIPLVLTDPTLLARALRNLVDDAVGHSAPDERPRLTATRAGDRVVLRIVDHGAGQRSALSFEPFGEIDDRHAGAGLGLGLAVARGLVEVCGGHLEAMPTPGGGRTMYLDLPCAPPEPEQAPDREVVR